MRVFVVGGGGREHAIAWRLALAGHEVIAAPGNPGIARAGAIESVSASDIEGLTRAIERRRPDLVVVGPEAPLVGGLADRARETGALVFGPGAEAARLEGSKVYAKELFRRHGIRTAEFSVCRSAREVERAARDLGGRVVVKADGLASGKGVVVCDGVDDAVAAGRAILEEGSLGAAGEAVVVERRLAGRELSIMALADGTRYEILAQAEDHKAVWDGDRGPNTGGMGAVSPARHASEALLERVRREIFDPTMAALAAEGIDYRGVLYAGLLIDENEAPWLLEYNCRFGDPEAQAVFARLRSDPLPHLAGAARGALPAAGLAWDDRAAVCVVLAASGYPSSPRKGDAIEGIAAAEAVGDVWVFHAGTREDANELVTAGGRVLGVTALGEDVARARERAYAAVSEIRFAGVHYRGDIGARAEKPGAL